ncbi:ABC transporter ATP-binding protein [Candidatus Micrarchaeota archaeon]|nr:ABC transporter ATP-binding protein [Candidatus Micrarchaeota archaeon]
MIRLENVYKKYVMGEIDFYALKKINFSINKNDFVVILGPSGSGKSTLLHILGLLDTPTEGKVYFRGKNTSLYTYDQLANIRFKDIGFVFQSFNLVQSLNALQNVMLPMMFYDVPYDVRLRKARQLLNRLGLSDKLYNLPSELSGGQQQRVSVARALVNDPNLILADEPTGNLDSKSGEEVYDILKEIHDNGKTVVIITHDVNVSKRKYVNKVIHIRDGMIEKIEMKK